MRLIVADDDAIFCGGLALPYGCGVPFERLMTFFIGALSVSLGGESPGYGILVWRWVLYLLDALYDAMHSSRPYRGVRWAAGEAVGLLGVVSWGSRGRSRGRALLFLVDASGSTPRHATFRRRLDSSRRDARATRRPRSNY